MTLSNEDVQDILALLDALPFDELTLETSRFTLTLRRAGDGVWAQETQVRASSPVPASPVPASPAPASSLPAGPVREVRAPLLGTFYRAPQPGAAPFVEVGSQVGPDTVVAIIETMKLMNPVYAGTAGTVSDICLDDGQFAAQDAVLMRVSGPAGSA